MHTCVEGTWPFTVQQIARPQNTGATEHPTTERLATERLATDRPAAERPATECLATERLATERSATGLRLKLRQCLERQLEDTVLARVCLLQLCPLANLRMAQTRMPWLHAAQDGTSTETEVPVLLTRFCCCCFVVRIRYGSGAQRAQRCSEWFGSICDDRRKCGPSYLVGRLDVGRMSGLRKMWEWLVWREVLDIDGVAEAEAAEAA